MAALTAARNTTQMADIPRSPISYKQKGSTTIYQGSLVVLNAGYAAPGTAATSLIAVGRAKKTSVNSGADGAVEVEVEEGIFKWANAGGDPILAANVGATVYITDDQTVNITATGKSAAGKCVRLDSDGAWVKTVL